MANLSTITRADPFGRGDLQRSQSGRICATNQQHTPNRSSLSRPCSCVTEGTPVLY